MTRPSGYDNKTINRSKIREPLLSIFGLICLHYADQLNATYTQITSFVALSLVTRTCMDNLY